VSPEALPGVIEAVYSTLNNLGTEAPPVEKPKPAVPVNKSVFPDHIVCLEDGKKLKMLRRHLRAAYGMTPEHYRERWGLPSSYPMVAPKYAAHRSALAKSTGLGRTATDLEAAPPPPLQRIPEGVRGEGAARSKKNR
jgi:predicted transcriptional regulator